MKIDTQGMSGPGITTGEWKYKDGFPDFEAPSISILEPLLRNELKELINEVLDERETRRSYLPLTSDGDNTVL